MKADGFVIALLGAESTGKTTLCGDLCAALRADGRDALGVTEWLRGFCETHGRTPRREEQAAIAAAQTLGIEAAAAAHAVVVADTTALMVAVYSDLIFGDTSLYAAAEAAQRRCGATLLTALDIPWQADGLQRDGPAVREPVDAKVRAALERSGVAYSVVSGSGPARLAMALAVVQRALGAAPGDDAGPGWRWVCSRCGDAGCERQLLAPAR